LQPTDLPSFADLQSERKVLAAMVHSEAACIEGISRLTEEHFTTDLHKRIFSLITDLYTSNILPTYAAFLREAQKTGLIDCPLRLKEVETVLRSWEYADSLQTFKYWANTVIKHSKAQTYTSILNRQKAALVDRGAKDIDLTIEETIDSLARISIGNEEDEFEDGKTIGAKLEKLIAEKIAKFQEQQVIGEMTLEGIPTGFKKLDELTLGYKPGDLIVLAAKTGHGKTSFALQTAKQVAIDEKLPVLYVNTEMSKEIVYQRLCSIISQVPFYLIRQGALNDLDQTRINKAVKAITNSPIYMGYTPNLTPARSVVLGKKAKIQKDVKMLIIDYIGRMEKITPDLKEWQVLEQVAKRMKLLAQELEIPVLVLAQLNEDGTLQGSRRIKNECDILLKLFPLTGEEAAEYRSKYHNANYRLYVDKNRDGESDKNIALHFEKAILHINCAEPVVDSNDYSDLGEIRGVL